MTDGEMAPAAVPLRPMLWWPGRRLPAPGRREGSGGSSVRPQTGATAARAVLTPWLVLAHRGDPRLAGAATVLEPLLDGRERERLRGLHRAADQERFLVGRGLLRLALGAWLGRDPASIGFQAGPHGKPELEPEPMGSGLQFNLAHAGELILLAFHPHGPVGVDVETLRPALAWQRLARRVLSPQACRELERLPPEAAPMAFLEHWCRLEARLKARGEGLAGLERLHRGDRLADGPAERLWPVAVPGSYRAAVALVGLPPSTPPSMPPAPPL